MKLKIFDWVFIGLVLIDIFAIYQYPGLRLISKPLVVSSLLIWYILETGEKQKPIILSGLMFALIGDIFLLFDFPSFFIAGIASFLIMQLCYINYFKSYYKKPEGNNLYYSIAVLIFAVLFNILFFNKLGEYKIHVAIYSIAVAVMVFMGINQQLSKSIMIGSLFFLFSDFALAFNKFISPNVALPGFVMATYAIAQYFIVKGVSVLNKQPKAI
jgi:uncharacterized membrane protein YhhN